MSTSETRARWRERYGSGEPKIVCVGLNYRSHASEAGAVQPSAPLLFGKFANALLDDGDEIVVARELGHVDAEAELAVIIGRRAHGVGEDEAFDYVDGYTCANDVSAREAQFGDGQWFRGKAIDGFCPVGPRIVPAAELDPTDLLVSQRLNGETLQSARTSDLIFSVATLISYVSRWITLERGDLILTGTPEGVGYFREPKRPLADGDVVEVEVEGIGVLRNVVRIEG